MNGVFLASYIALWVLVLVIAIGLFGLYHHFGQMYLSSREGRAAQGPTDGVPLKRLRTADVNDDPIVLPPPGNAAVIVFTTTTCQLCARLRPDLARFATMRSDIETVLLCGGSEDDVRAWALGLPENVRVIPDKSGALLAKYGIGVVPFFAAVDSHGIVRAKGLVNDEVGLEWAAHSVSADALPEPV